MIAAKLFLPAFGSSTPERREEVARWLEAQAKSLREVGSQYGARFTATHELMPKKLHKGTLKKGHKIAKAIIRKGGGADNPYAVGVAAAKKLAKKRKRGK